MSGSTDTHPAPTRQPMTAAERVRRNREIAEMRAAGEPWAAIGERFGLSERQARRAEREHLQSEHVLGMLEEDPGAVLREPVGIHRWALERLERLAERGDNSSARLGAVRTRVATARDLVDLLARAGLIPDGPYAWRFEVEASAFVKGMLAVADRHGIEVEDILREMEGVPGAAPAVRRIAA